VNAEAKPTKIGKAFDWTPIPAQAYDFAASGQAEDPEWRRDRKRYLEGQLGNATIDCRGVFVQVASTGRFGSYFFGKKA
jgi:hypothetical protein